METAIQVEKVGKRFWLQSRGWTLKSAALDIIRPRARAQRPALWALRDISFTVRPGEALGIIGANGAGKSTLLALLAGTMMPSEGRIATRGTVSCLLELGAGFHPDLTGRENIFLFGASMGLSRRKMQSRMEAIVDFAGLSEFIDQPVRHYSSGMYVRLGFAVAVEVDPDVLLIDEVLAVGDAAFQRKCLRRMAQFRELGKTMLMISHDLAALQTFSDRLIFLDGGRIIQDDLPGKVVSAYETFWRRKDCADLQREWGTREVLLNDVTFESATGLVTDKFRCGEPLRVRIRYRAERRIESPVFGYTVADRHGHLIHGNNTQIERFAIPFIEGDGEIVLHLDQLHLGTGTYLFSFSVHSADHVTNYHRRDNAFPVEVYSDLSFEGCCYLPCHWEIPARRRGGE